MLLVGEVDPGGRRAAEQALARTPLALVAHRGGELVARLLDHPGELVAVLAAQQALGIQEAEEGCRTGQDLGVVPRLEHDLARVELEQDLGQISGSPAAQVTVEVAVLELQQLIGHPPAVLAASRELEAGDDLLADRLEGVVVLRIVRQVHGPTVAARRIATRGSAMRDRGTAAALSPAVRPRAGTNGHVRSLGARGGHERPVRVLDDLRPGAQ